MVSPSSLRNIRALLIEDNPADIYLIREALKRELVQFELEVVDNGEAASRLVDRFANEPSNRPDVILLDLNLPRCDGREVLQKLRQIPAGRESL